MEQLRHSMLFLINHQPQQFLQLPQFPAVIFFNITAPTSAASGHTEEIGTTSTFTVKLRNSPELAAPATVTTPTSDFYTISNISGHTSEDGTISTFSVALKVAPTEDVTVNVSSSNTSEGIVSPSTLTFTQNNWNTTQTVAVTGVNDTDIDGHQEYKNRFCQLRLLSLPNC